MEVVSIIIPVYNVKDYLHRCLDSILNQTYSALEVIVIDDGSTDGSGKICDYYAAKDKRIFVLHKENEGVSKARNVGLEKMTGKYFCFVDSDDYIELDMIAVLVESIISSEFDIATVSSYKGRSSIAKAIKKYTKQEAMKMFLLGNSLRQEVWGKLFRTKVFFDLRFVEGKAVAEDKYYLFQSLIRANSICVKDVELYHYETRVGSVTSIFSRKYEASFYFSKLIMDIGQTEMPELTRYFKFNYYDTHCNILYKLYSSNCSEDLFKETILKCYKVIKEFKFTDYLKVVSIKKIIKLLLFKYVTCLIVFIRITIKHR